MRYQKGFTLIEIMIVVGIVAILSAIAIPSYTEYVIRARITEATAALSAMRVKMEQYFQDNRRYNNPAQPPCLGAGTSVAPRPISANFTYNCPVLTATTFTVTATGNAGTTMAGFVFSIDQLNNRATTGVAPSWAATAAVPAACWILKKDGTC